MWANAGSYTTVGEAEAARSALEAAGIEAEVADENTISVDWLYSQAVGGVKVRVPEESLAEAAEVLANAAQDVEPGGDTEAAATERHCPRCGSREYYHVIWRRLRAASLLFSFGFFLIAPVWLLLPKWKCDSCGLRRWFR